MSDSIGNELIILLAQMNDEERANELLAVIGEGRVDTVAKAGAAIELYALGTGTTLADAVAHLSESPDAAVEGSPACLGLQWLRTEHPELF